MGNSLDHISFRMCDVVITGGAEAADYADWFDAFQNIARSFDPNGRARQGQSAV
jgi:hypothetical protein